MYQDKCRQLLAIALNFAPSSIQSTQTFAQYIRGISVHPSSAIFSLNVIFLSVLATWTSNLNNFLRPVKSPKVWVSDEGDMKRLYHRRITLFLVEFVSDLDTQVIALYR